MDGQSDKFAVEIGTFTPEIGEPPVYTYTILQLKPTRELFRGYGGNLQEVQETAEAHIAFLNANGDTREDRNEATRLQGRI